MQILPGNHARSYAAHRLMSSGGSAVIGLLRTHRSLSDVFPSNQDRGTCVFELSPHLLLPIFMPGENDL